jgi:hypothetical protein
MALGDKADFGRAFCYNAPTLAPKEECIRSRGAAFAVRAKQAGVLSRQK